MCNARPAGGTASPRRHQHHFTQQKHTRGERLAAARLLPRAGAAKRRRSAAPSRRSRTTPPISRATEGTRLNEIIIMTRHPQLAVIRCSLTILTTHDILLTLKGEMRARDSTLFDRRRRCNENPSITYTRKGTYNSYVQQYYSKLVTEKKIAIQYVRRA